MLLYVRFEQALAPRTAHHIHVVLSACLKAAVRTGLIVGTPMARVATSRSKVGSSWAARVIPGGPSFRLSVFFGRF
jgi:hypothetical protein